MNKDAPSLGSVICIKRKSFIVLMSAGDIVRLAPMIDGEARLDLTKTCFASRLEPWRLMRKKAKLVLA